MEGEPLSFANRQSRKSIVAQIVYIPTCYTTNERRPQGCLLQIYPNRLESANRIAGGGCTLYLHFWQEFQDIGTRCKRHVKIIMRNVWEHASHETLTLAENMHRSSTNAVGNSVFPLNLPYKFLFIINLYIPPIPPFLCTPVPYTFAECIRGTPTQMLRGKRVLHT